jgi:hypothetical protein
MYLEPLDIFVVSLIVVQLVLPVPFSIAALISSVYLGSGLDDED